MSHEVLLSAVIAFKHCMSPGEAKALLDSVIYVQRAATMNTKCTLVTMSI